MHFTTKETVLIDKEGGVTLPDHIFSEVQLSAFVLQLLRAGCYCTARRIHSVFVCLLIAAAVLL